MPEVNFNKRVSPEVAQQTNLGTSQDMQEQKKELPPLLSPKTNLTVSKAPVDLEALVGKLKLETMDTKENSAKQTLQGAFTAVIARALERGNVSARNMALLEQAENYGKQLDITNTAIDTLTAQNSQLKDIVATQEKEVAQVQKNVDTLAAEIAELEAKMQLSDAQISLLQIEIDSLASQIESEIDAQKQANLKKRLATQKQKLEKEKENLIKLQAQKEVKQAELANAQTKLETAKANLADVNVTLADAEAVLAAAMTAKAGLKQKINQALSEISDESVIRDIADKMKVDVSDVALLLANDQGERSEEEEKFLETHNPVKILEDALSEHYQEILDAIAAKRENIV